MSVFSKERYFPEKKSDKRFKVRHTWLISKISKALHTPKQKKQVNYVYEMCWKGMTTRVG